MSGNGVTDPGLRSCCHRGLEQLDRQFHGVTGSMKPDRADGAWQLTRLEMQQCRVQEISGKGFSLPSFDTFYRQPDLPADATLASAGRPLPSGVAGSTRSVLDHTRTRYAKTPQPRTVIKMGFSMGGRRQRLWRSNSHICGEVNFPTRRRRTQSSRYPCEDAAGSTAVGPGMCFMILDLYRQGVSVSEIEDFEGRSGSISVLQ